MQYFKIQYTTQMLYSRTHTTYAVSMRDGDKVVPRLLSHLKHPAIMSQLFNMSEVLTIKSELPIGIEIEELPLKDLYEYLVLRPSNLLLKSARIVSEAWYSFNGGTKFKQREGRKVSAEVQDKIKKRLKKKGVKKAQIARDLGISRNGLYKAIAKIERQEFENKCDKGYISQLGFNAFSEAMSKGLGYIEAKKQKELVKEKEISRLVGFDLGCLKIDSIV